jgi:molybdate transport system substrate-binding protein
MSQIGATALRLKHKIGSVPRVAQSGNPGLENLASSGLRFLLVVILTLFFGLSLGCRSQGTSPTANELTVSAAVSLRDAFNEIADLYEKRNGSKIHFNYGASGALQKQIESGAPADVFASAGAKQMDDLAAKNFIVSDSRKDFARNSLVLIVPSQRASVSSFIDLANPSVKRVAVGNPKTVPAGAYTVQALSKLGLLPGIQTKLIFAEDVRQVLDYVVRDEVDAGVVYSSDALSSGDKIKVVAQAADDSHDPILYPIAVVKDSNRQKAARAFVDLVLSSEGQAILIRHGFRAMK